VRVADPLQVNNLASCMAALSPYLGIPHPIWVFRITFGIIGADPSTLFGVLARRSRVREAACSQRGVRVAWPMSALRLRLASAIIASKPVARSAQVPGSGDPEGKGI
jgi:hypothetical protein